MSQSSLRSAGFCQPSQAASAVLRVLLSPALASAGWTSLSFNTPLRYSHVLVGLRVVVQGGDHALKSAQALHRFVRLARCALILRRSEPGQHQVEAVVAAGAHPGPAVDFGFEPQ